MDLLAIDERTLNLDRLTMVCHLLDPTKTISLVFGDGRVELNAMQSAAFRDYVTANARLIDLRGETPPRVSHGRTVSSAPVGTSESCGVEEGGVGVGDDPVDLDQA